MRRTTLLFPLLVSLPLFAAPLACGSKQPAGAQVPTVAASGSAAPAGSASTAAAPATSDSAAAPSAAAESAAMEHGPAANADKQLEADRTKWQDQRKAEEARLTPEIHAEAKALAEKSFPNGKAAITAVAKSKLREPANAARDKYRHPVETLAFFGFKPTMTVLDIGPGEGWYTELLAPALAKSGKYVATITDPNGAPNERGSFNGQKFKGFLEDLPEAYGKVETEVVDPKAPKLAEDGTVDLVVIMRGIHGMKNNGVLDAWLAQIHKALKPGGVLGIEEHRAAKGADPAESSKKGYVPEAWLVEQVDAAGFKLAGKSEVNANPKDTKDYSEGVWTLPPTFRLGDKDHDKYAAIGESDRMTLKFVKVTPKVAATPKSDAPKPADSPSKTKSATK
ncbi:MAG TPA: methyltransferase domain-containing protein [Polyangiaceae bacterium]|jgi:predicted methyltransferase